MVCLRGSEGWVDPRQAVRVELLRGVRVYGHGGLSKLWSLYGSPKLGPVLGPVL